MPNAYIKENFDLIKIRNIPNFESIDIENTNIFEYISTISSITSFNISFNCLEKKTFENILFILQNNYNLHELKLNFFPSDELYVHNLIKIGEECGVFKSLKINVNQNDIDLITDKNIEKILKQKLLEYFEINLEKLFLLFQTKRNLDKLELIIKLPTILLERGEDNEGYHVAILKFILNLIILLNTEKIYLKEFKLSMPYFNFNNRAYPIIGEIFEKINLLRKNPQLKIFYFEAMMFKIYNIQNIISYNLQNLFLGELDLETFHNFIQLYQSDEFLANSKLTKLNISLNKTVIKYNVCKNEISKFFSNKHPTNLEDISFKCYFRIKRKNLYDLLKNSNRNQIKKYNIQMKIDKLKKYRNIIEHKEFYFMNNNIEKKISSILPVFKKYDFLQEKYNKIAKNIFKYYIPSNIKKINIIEIK
jgi:hypothetical protein